MNKQFLTIEEQVSLLRERGVATSETTAQILLREGYYAVVNGYGKAFLDEAASAAAHGDRFLAGTTFDDMYRLFLFDRELRVVTFRALMCVEGTLRSLLSHTFTEHHPKPESYLREGCYATSREYLLGERAFAGDLAWLINTLEHHARGYQNDEHDSDRYDDRRLAWYRERYDAIPLWVLFSDLTFGNLRYFFALMRRAEQRVVCERLREACGTTAQGQTLTPKALLHDLEALGLLRNCCAHEERIYNATFGTDELTYLQMLERLAAFLADEDEERLYRAVNTLVKRFGEMSPHVQTALANAGF